MGHGKNNRRRGHKKVVRKGSHVLKYRNKNVGNYKLKVSILWLGVILAKVFGIGSMGS